ncbi:MAG: sugar phosphate isomerase/epimerase [Bacteroidales bacterium]|nr:MAG: sugar phosphate isomerase/epimerase [Bacteroidales bacterium]
MNTRRTFIKKSGTFAIGSLVIPSVMSYTKEKTKNIGLQIYSVRDQLSEDLEGTLKQVAKIGYKWIELASYDDGKFYNKTPAEFKKLVDDLGMEIISSHTGVEIKGVDMSNAEKLADAHAELGLTYVIKPWLVEERRVSADSYKKVAEELNKIGEIMKSRGLKFGYHNHDFEFETVDDHIPFDILLTETDKELVTFEIDLYWIKKGGKNTTDYFKKYPGRFELYHVKDMDNTEESYFTEVGSGIINFKELFSYKDLAGMKYFFVEQDNCRNYTPLESVKISFDYLNNCDFI